MALIEVPMISLDTTGEGVVVIVVASLEGSIFLLGIDCLFVEGDMMMNKVDGLVGCEWIPGSSWNLL